MNRFSFIAIMSIIMLVVSCNMPDKQQAQVPDSRKISSEQMENIVYEMHKADAVVTLQMIQITGHTSIHSGYTADSLLYESIYAKYDCTRESFEESILWYLQNESDSLKSIYEKAINRLNVEKATSKQPQKQ